MGARDGRAGTAGISGGAIFKVTQDDGRADWRTLQVIDGPQR